MSRIVNYEKQTLDHPNPLSRYAHRTRFKISKKIVTNWVEKKFVVLDYGCGHGRFLSELSLEAKIKQNDCELMGFDPYLDIKYENFTIINDQNGIEDKSLDIITCLEVVEHLDDNEIEFFLQFAQSKLKDGGRILITVPIMLGPALFLKEIIRSILFRRPSDTNFLEMIKAGIFGISPPRTGDIKGSHKGFNWKVAKHKISQTFANDKISFSPIPLIGWYGNSQAIMRFCKKNNL